jgi:hypothetical protein
MPFDGSFTMENGSGVCTQRQELQLNMRAKGDRWKRARDRRGFFFWKFEARSASRAIKTFVYKIQVTAYQSSTLSLIR